MRAVMSFDPWRSPRRFRRRPLHTASAGSSTMRQSPIHLAIGFLLAIAGLHLTGCTVIGYLAGSAIDKGNAEVVEVRVRSLSEMPIGAHCRLKAIDSTAITGEYAGIRLQGRQRYEAWKAEDPSRIDMPSMGDSLQILTDATAAPPLRGDLVAMSDDSLWLHSRRGSSVFLQSLPLRDIRSIISASGGPIDGQRLRDYTSRTDFPNPFGIVVQGRDAENVIPVDSVASIDLLETTTPGLGRSLLTMVGLCVDVYVVNNVNLNIGFSKGQ